MTGGFRKLLSAKIHRGTVTAADVNYEGSVTIPPELMEAAEIYPYESVHVWNVTRGSRLETYAIAGLHGSRDICANGAAAHLIRPGDQVIIASYAWVAAEKVQEHRPKLIFVDEANRIVHSGPEVAGPERRDAAEIGSATPAGAAVGVETADSAATPERTTPPRSSGSPAHG